MPDEAFSLAKYIGGSALALFVILIGKRIIEKVVKKIVDWPGSVERRFASGDKKFAEIQQELAVQSTVQGQHTLTLKEIKDHVLAIYQHNGGSR